MAEKRKTSINSTDETIDKAISLIRDETEDGQNTAERVAGVFQDIADSYVHVDEKANHVHSDYLSRTSQYAADNGSVNAYVGDYGSSVSTPSAGFFMQFLATNANTGQSTFRISGSDTDRPIKKNAIEDLTEGDILAGQIVSVVFDGNNWQMVAGAGGAEVQSVELSFQSDI